MTRKPTPAEFQAEYYNIRSRFKDFAGPLRANFRGEVLRVGDKAPSFQLPSLDGEEIDLDALRADGNNVALVFGSYSAWPCVVEMPAIEELHRETENTSNKIVFIYTREIHPNEPIAPNSRVFPSHSTIEQKFEAARSMRDDLGLTMKICVDDLVGTTHLAYGSLPFAQFVVHKDGTLVHRSEWGVADLLAASFKNLLAAEKQEIARATDGIAEKFPPAYAEMRWFR